MVKFQILCMVVSLAVLGVILFQKRQYFDNTDYRIEQEDFLNGQKLFVNGRRQLEEEDELVQLQAKLQQQEQETMDSLKQIFDTNQNICLNGKQGKIMSKKEIVEEFIKGPCNPVILLPGIAGTSLQIEIDCEKLQSQSPEVFSSCGWQTCSSLNFWQSKPNKEYRLWISTSTSKMGIIMYRKDNHCFGNIIQQIYNSSNINPQDRYSDIPGLKISVFGQTPETAKNNQCGLGAIQSMSDDLVIKNFLCDQKGFKNIPTLFDNMGYISGLLYQAIPYDYRKNINSQKTVSQIVRSIENLYQITGKRVIILAHSLGSLYALHTMNIQSQKWKDQHISTLMTFGAPYLGTSKVIRSNLGGDPGYLSHYLGLNLGINYYCQNMAINTMSSVQDLYPKDTYNRFRDQPWMMEILARINYEQNYLLGLNNMNDPLPMDWFPGPTEQCTYGFTNRKNQCLTYLSDMSEPILEINGQNFSSSRDQINHVFDQFSMNATLLKQFYNESLLQNLEDLQHPGVPIIVVFGNFQKVEERFQYDKNPKDVITQKQDFYFPNVTKYQIGDGSVIVSSAITPAIKWIYEHKYEKFPHPTKLIEFCSTYNKVNLTNIYDGEDQEGGKIIKTSGYMGLECECLNNKKDINNCQHSCMINDKHIIELTKIIVKTQQMSSYKDFKTPFNEDQLNKFVNDCVSLRGDQIIQAEF